MRFATACRLSNGRSAMAAFLVAQGWSENAPSVLAGDASFRRYYRLLDGKRRAVLMDAPPPREDVGPYVTVAGILRAHGFSAPEIYAEDRANGFLLIEDFGDDTYTKLLAKGADEAALYTLAIDTLVALHRVVEAERLPDLPPYDEERLLTEAGLLVEWYAPCVLGAPLAEKVRDDYRARWREVLPQAELPAPTLVLRDYHVDNLMLLPGREAVQSCGLLDFQDAVRGPASYDLVSLLKDARRDVPAARRSATARSSASSRGCGGAMGSRNISATSRGSGGSSKRICASRCCGPLPTGSTGICRKRRGSCRQRAWDDSSSDIRHGAGGGARDPHAADQPNRAKAVDRAGRPDLARSCDRPARPRRGRAGRRQCALQGGADRRAPRRAAAAENRDLARRRIARNRRRRHESAAAPRRCVLCRQQRRLMARRQGLRPDPARRRVRGIPHGCGPAVAADDQRDRL